MQHTVYYNEYTVCCTVYSLYIYVLHWIPHIFDFLLALTIETVAMRLV